MAFVIGIYKAETKHSVLEVFVLEADDDDQVILTKAIL